MYKRQGLFMDWAWLRFIVNVLTNEAVMEPLIAVILGYGVNVSVSYTHLHWGIKDSPRNS